jgi:transposase
VIVNTVGIDVSKDKFDVALSGEHGVYHCTFSNDAKGMRGLLAWLKQRQAVQAHACLEATGAYGLDLTYYLHQAGVTVSVVNPACIKAFAQSQLRRTKTDKVDAVVIAQFCRAMQPQPWKPPSAEIAHLQALARRLEDLQSLRTQEINRLKIAAAPEAVKQSARQVVQVLQQQIKALKSQIRVHCRQYPELKAQIDLLTSIKGIGFITAVVLVSEVVDIGRYRSARQLAAYAGLVPCERVSGSSVRGKARLSKRGNARLRKALYFPALTARRANAPLRAFADRLRAKGKAKMAVIAAVMRKLLHQVYGVLKHGRPFDPNYQPLSICNA